MCHPLRLLTEVIDSVANGSFNSDLARSGLFAKEEEAIELVSSDWQPAPKDGDESVCMCPMLL